MVVLVRRVVQRLAPDVGADVVDQDLQSAHLRGGFLKHPLPVVGFGHVGSDAERQQALRAPMLDLPFDLDGIAGDDKDARAQVKHLFGDGKAQPFSRAGDQRPFPRQSPALVHLFFFRQ